VTAAARAALARKYRTMAALRRVGAPDERAEDRAKLRALATEFPGALRELDTLPTDEIDRRVAALETTAVEPWMHWLCDFHTVMRAALEIKRAIPAPEARSAAIRAGLDDAFVAAVAAPPHGRLMVVVFDRLAKMHGVPAKQIWDTLFPPRKGDRAYRKR
jgi:hypothetical protein